MSWPERETFDEMMQRVRRGVAAKRKAQSLADKVKAQVEIRVEVEPEERMERPQLRRSALPPQIERFPTDEELDRMWGKA